GTAALPPVINRIDGGSFTPASDTRLSLYSVSHGMGVQPKGFFLWCDDNEESGGAYPVQTALFGYILRVNADYGGSSSSGSFNVTYRKTNDYVTGVSLTLSEAQLDQAMTTASCSFAWRNGEYYKAGCTYKWLVWA
ncbi:MAG: hypothetical protein HUJ66_06565, partial [Oscillospiraceae bacterium]|nr:hypothetical protein [Oscillospiraceae bacterium]